jgi:DNA-directed RNA polymerase subunit RPC12/RpoP
MIESISSDHRIAVRLNIEERILPAENSEQVVEPEAQKKTEHGHGPQCPRCGSDYLKRMRRRGFLQVRVYPVFGYYPWKCTTCLGSVMLKKRNVSRRHQHTEADVPINF